MKFNAAQKKQLNAAIERMTDAEDEIHVLKDMLQEQFDERSEKWQESAAGERFQDLLDEVENQQDTAAEIINALQELV